MNHWTDTKNVFDNFSEMLNNGKATAETNFRDMFSARYTITAENATLCIKVNDATKNAYILDLTGAEAYKFAFLKTSNKAVKNLLAAIFNNRKSLAYTA